MENEEKKEQECLSIELKKIVENKLQEFRKADLNPSNLDILYKLVDIHKDLENEDYWKVKKEVYKNEIQRL